MTTPELIDYQGQLPTLGDEVFVAPGAAVVGDVQVGDQSSIWYNTVVRGDVYPVRIGSRTNVQDGTVVHVTGGKHDTAIGDEVTIGHGAIIHGCQIGDRCLVGMGATILDGAVIQDYGMVAAGALVPPGMVVPSETLVMGSPAKVVRDLTVEEIEKLEESAAKYVDLARKHNDGRL